MRQGLVTGRSLLAGAIAGTIVLAVGVSFLHPPPMNKSAPAALPAGAGALSPKSLYQLSSVWTTDEKKTMPLVELRGSFQVLAMMFTHCPAACPMLVKQIQAMERVMPGNVKANTRFVLISLDPERDTPGVLKDYRNRMGLDRERWTLLRGNATGVRELAATLGFNYGKGGATDFVHTKLVTVLNPEGEIIHQQPGVGDDPHRVIDAIEKAMRSRARL